MASTTKPNGNDSALVPGGPQSNRTSLSMSDVFYFSVAIADRRGWPQESQPFFGQQIVWLEERGLPGLTAMFDDTMRHLETPWNERLPKPGLEGRERLDCPFLCGGMLEGSFEDLLTVDEGQWGRIDGPSVPFLLLPRIAGYAKKTGKPVHLGWLVGTPPTIEAQSIVDGDRLVSIGQETAVMNAEGIAFRHFDDVMPEEATATIREIRPIPGAELRSIAAYIGEVANDDPAPTIELLGRDDATVELLKKLSKGDVAALRYAAWSRFDDTESDESGNEKARMIQFDSAVQSTDKASPNFALFERLVVLGWMRPQTCDGVDDTLREFAWTERGFRLLPQFFSNYMRAFYPAHQGAE